MRKYLLIRCIALGMAALWAFGSAQAQFQPNINLTWPKDGAVFQQNNAGKCDLSMLGTFPSKAYKLSFYTLSTTLKPIDVKAGTPLNKPSRTANVFRVTGGFILSTFENVEQGWYEMTVKAEPKPGFTTLPTLQQKVKVGVGEVFIIAGQSNAQGLDNNRFSSKVAPYTSPLDGVRVQIDILPTEGGEAASALPDATRFRDDYDKVSLQSAVSFNPSSGIGPAGPSQWLWGRLGEQIVNGYLATGQQVPVAFYNAAWGGTTITEWARSTDPNKAVAGGSVASDQNPTNLFPGFGQPYSLLQKTLRLYGSLYGARAVLWQQGETDTRAINAFKSATDDAWGSVRVRNKDLTFETYLRRVENSDQYRDRLKQVINQSRIDFFGAQIPWMVAKASYNEGVTNSIVTGGQTGLGLTGVFDGPVMDNLISTSQRRQPSDIIIDPINPNDPSKNDNFGPEPTHFKASGLTDAANAWYSRIIASGLLNATPIDIVTLGTVAQTSSMNLEGGNNALAPSNNTPNVSYKWVVENNNTTEVNNVAGTGQVFTVNPGSGCQNCSPPAPTTRRAFIQLANGRYIVSQAVTIPYAEIDDTGTPPTTCAAPTSGSCYTIKVQKTDLFLQTVNGGATIQQLPANSQTNQLWKIEDTGNSRYRFIIQDGTNRVVQTTTGTNGNYLALGNYTGDDKQRWGIGAQNGFYRVFTSNNTTWDLLDFGNQATLQLYGNTGEPFYNYRSFCFTPATCPTTCDLNLTASNTNPNAQCNQSAQLNFGCVGADCNGATFTWSGNGINQTVSAGQGLGTGALTTDGSRTYTLTATKGGCQQAVQTTVTVTGCVTPPPTSCAEAESGSRSPGTDVQSGGNASGGQYVGGFDGASRYVDIAVNVASAGSYPLTFYYSSGEAGGYIDYRVNGGGMTRLSGIATTGGWNTFAASSAVTVALNAGNNTIRVQGGFRFTLDRICVGGTPPPPPGCFGITPSASNPNPACNAAITLNANCGGSDCNGVSYTWSGNGLSGGGSSIGVTPPASTGNYTYNVSASKPGCPTQNGTVTVSVSCGGGPFALNPPTLDCASGNVALSVTGSNGNTVEYQAIGLRGWGTGNVLTVPAHQLSGTDFTFQARQSGNGEASRLFRVACGGRRAGVETVGPDAEDTDRGLVISPNPSSGRVSVRFVLGLGERGSVSVQSLSGAVLQSRAVVGTGSAQTEVLDLEREPAGLYLIRVSGSGGNNAQTGRVLLLR